MFSNPNCYSYHKFTFFFIFLAISMPIIIETIRATKYIKIPKNVKFKGMNQNEELFCKR